MTKKTTDLKRRLPAGGPVLLTLTAAVTAAAQEPAGAGVSVRDSAGVRIVENLEPTGAASEWALSRRPLVEIGVVEGAAEYQLDRVSEVRALADGRVLVANGGTNELRLYDPEGRYLRAFGGRGEGPGEFESLTGLAVVGDSIYAYDAEAWRLSVFHLEQGYGRSTRLDASDDPIYTPRYYRLVGSLAPDRLQFTLFSFDAGRKPTPTLYWDAAPNLVYDPSGQLVDTVGGFSGMDMYGDPQVGTQVEFGAVSWGDARDGRFVVGHGHRYELEVHGRDGSLEMLIRKRERPVRVDDAFLEAYLDARLRRSETAEERRMWRRSLEDDIEHGRVAETLPFTRRIVLAHDGDIWVQRYRAPLAEGPDGWDIFAPSGRLRGTVNVPPEFAITDVRGDRVLGVARDALDVQYVRVYRLTGNSLEDLR